MSSPNVPPAVSSSRPSRGAGRWLVIGFFGLLSAAFLFRLVQNARHWLAGQTTADANYKALTLWCLVYVLVCGGLAAFTYWLPGDDREEDPAK